MRPSDKWKRNFARRRDRCEACGKKKFPEYHFCRACYLLLPVEMRRALYRVTDGSAYKAALEYLGKLQGKLFSS